VNGDVLLGSIIMTRHGRNATASAVYTYHEKKKDSRQSGYGALTSRLNKDSVKDFDACCLTLQPCRNPVITPHGYLFDKESILEYIITKKRDITKQQKLYENQKNKSKDELAELGAAEARSKAETFLDKQKGLRTSEGSDESGASTSKLTDDKHLPSFWIPSLIPDHNKEKIEKPDKNIYCPMSGEVLKMKDMVSVKFTEVKDPDDKKTLINKTNRYMCPVTHDILGNNIPVAVIKTTGDVITVECIDKIIKPDGMVFPLTGEKLHESDIIIMQRGGTGFASANENLKVTKARQVLRT